MLQVRENETLLRRCSGGTAHLRASEDTLAPMVKLANHDREDQRKIIVSYYVRSLPSLKDNNCMAHFEE